MTDTTWKSNATEVTSFELPETKYADLTCDQKALFNKRKAFLERTLEDVYFHQLRLGAGDDSLSRFVNHLIVNDTDQVNSFWIPNAGKTEVLAKKLASEAAKYIVKFKLSDSKNFYEGKQLMIVKGGRESCKSKKSTATSCDTPKTCSQKKPRRKSTKSCSGGRSVTPLSSTRRRSRRARRSCASSCN